MSSCCGQAAETPARGAQARSWRSAAPCIGAISKEDYDGIIVDDSVRGGQYIPATGGWADASDYLQYVTTSANATLVMLLAHRDHAGAFADHFDADGLPGGRAGGHPAMLPDRGRPRRPGGRRWRATPAPARPPCFAP